MATQQFGGFIFQGTLKVRLECPPDRCDVLRGRAQQPPWRFLYRFGTTPTTPERPERLKIDAPQVWFDCQVKASGKGNIDDWEAGILQSISHASWVAHYSNGAELRYRVNTGQGLIRDGESTDYLFFRNGHSLKATALSDVYEVQFMDHDSPSVTFVTEFSGDPFHPHALPGNRLGQLNRTEGKVDFHTFLAMVNQRTESIITLAESHWTLTWDGTYDVTTKTWNPNDPDGIITHTESCRAITHENPRHSAVPLPFSLEPAVANERKEIRTLTGWIACREGLPDLGDGHRGGR
jgi:hypothetical protein